MENRNPMFECPRFDFCSINHCPLDLEKDKHLTSKYDKERECTLNKKLRMRIGNKLTNLGLKPKESVKMKEFHPELFKGVKE